VPREILPAEHGRSHQNGRLIALLAVALTGGICCAHHSSAPPKSAAVQAARDPSPGARTEEERTHVLEAQWTEVEVKGRKQGDTVVSAIKLVQPKIRLFHAAPPPADVPAQKKDRPAQPNEVVDLNDLLHKITPLEVDHIDILDGQVAFVDTSRKERPEIWLHDLQLSVENLTNRVRLTEGRPVLLTASGTLARSGTVSILITADPFEKGLTFSGRAAVVGLETSELYRFIEPATKLQVPQGTVDIFVEFDCRNGALTGGVKPVLKNVKIRPNDKNPFSVLKAWVTDLAVRVFSDRVRDRNAVATVIPIKGTLTGPDVELWPAIFGVLRNAFVEGLTSGYAELPPKTVEAPPAPPAPAARTSPSESHSSSPPSSP
jgi:Domain of Unknown Function (DUF748)